MPRKHVKGKTILETAFALVLILVLYAALLIGCENKIIFHPNKYPLGYWEPQSLGVQAEDIFFNAADGVKLHGWFIAADSPRATLLWFHGNAGNLTHRLDNIKKLRPLHLNIFIFDYRGYGRSDGEPDEPGIYLDSQAAYEVLIGQKGILPEKLFLFGRSLGAACAVRVAANNPAGGLILESPFTSAKDMANKMFPLFLISWALRSELNSLDKVPHLQLPKLFLHGTRDEVVPYALGKKLYDAASEPKEFYDIQGAGHNDTYVVGGQDYFNALDRFITRTLKDRMASRESDSGL